MTHRLAKWAQQVWKENGSKWLDREGQDHFYRDAVVIPALSAAVVEHASPRVTLIDLGAGDGYTTHALVRQLRKTRVQLDAVVLADRSLSECRHARALMGDQGVTIVREDLLEPGAISNLARRTKYPVVVVSVFVLQELPCLRSFMAEVAAALKPGSLFAAVVVAPTFADRLRRRGAVRVIGEAADRQEDWSWYGLYPISSRDTTFYLPHFQRRLVDYTRLISGAGLRVGLVRPLFVPSTQASRAVFRSTTYGESILGSPSSTLIIARPR